MGKGFGIAALIFLFLSLPIPFFGNFVTLLALAIAALGALFGDKAYAIATTTVAGVKLFFLSPSWAIVLYASTTDEQTKALYMGLTVLFLALPIAAIVLNATGRLAFKGGKKSESSAS